jgi:hypothetical protein
MQFLGEEVLVRSARFSCAVRSIVLLVGLGATNAFAASIIFTDDFSTNTTGSYTWSEAGAGDGNPTNNYTYDAANQWLTVSTADNVNVYMKGTLPAPIRAGSLQFSFLPMQTYPTDGLVRMHLFGVGGTSYMYEWSFSHNCDLPDPGYRASLEKWVNGSRVVHKAFVPTPASYALGQWHTMAMIFSPTSISGFLDGQLMRTELDPTAASFMVNSFEIAFQQQDQLVDNIIVQACDSCAVPAPAGIFLASLGTAAVSWMRRRRAL